MSFIPRQPPRRTFFSLPKLPFSPFPSPSSSSSSTDRPQPKGTLTKQGSLSVYRESRTFPYSPQQLYAIIADVDSYHAFLPFCASSSVLHAAKGKEKAVQPLAGKGWLREGEEGEVWALEAELQVGAMGFQEGYVSKVDAVKWSSVAATAKDTSMFRQLHTRWDLASTPPMSDGVKSPNHTNVDLYLAWAFASPFHAAAVGAMWERVSGLMVDGFEKRARQVYGKR